MFEDRAAEAPAIRRLFSPSIRDPRYHMLSHLSTKFTDLPPNVGQREPRAALFLNRYTRTLTIMYATDGLADVLGITGDELHGKSFYFCMQQQCLRDAVHCLENAKANDSIAYLRFWYQDPRLVDVGEEFRLPTDTDASSETSDSASGSPQSEESVSRVGNPSAGANVVGVPSAATAFAPPPLNVPGLTAGSSSGAESSSYAYDPLPGQIPQRFTGSTNSDTPRRRASQPIQLEAVISCTSDGLVVCLRVAAPAPQGLLVPTTIHPNFTPYFGEPQQYVTHYEPVDGAYPPSAYTTGLRATYGPPQAAPAQQPPAPVPQHVNAVGHQGYQGPQVYAGEPQPLYAVPWATQPMLPPNYTQPDTTASGAFAAQAPAQHTYHPAPPNRQNDFMSSIKEMAVFAWALVGINGSLAEHGNGTPHGEARPPSGGAVWSPGSRIDAAATALSGKPRHSSSGIQHDSAIDSDSSLSMRRPMMDGAMSDGDGRGDISYQTWTGDQRTLPGFEAFKQGTHSPKDVRDKDGMMVDGVDSPPRDGDVRGSTSSSDRTPNTQPGKQWGFGDPGLKSRGAGLFNPALQNLSPTATFQTDHENK